MSELWALDADGHVAEPWAIYTEEVSRRSRKPPAR